MNEAELLFTEILNCQRSTLYLDKDSYLDKDKSRFVSSVLKRRIKAEPIQYILGKTEFMGLEFKVNQDVFIPRPETEILVETAVKFVSGLRCRVSGMNILDIGTGTGCIAVCLAKFLSKARVDAIDISATALEIARANAKLHNVEINFIQSDLFTNYELRFTNYDIIVNNPPYIATSEIDKLQPEIQYEPRISLDGGSDGLDFYRRIIYESGTYLKKGGLLILEMGFKQCQKIKEIFKLSKKFEIIETVKDYNHIERVIVAKYG